MTRPNEKDSRTSIFAWRLTGRWRLAVCLALVLVSVVPRTADLGRLSFYGDEETSAFAARYLAQGEAAQMPSGMEYRRALPLSWLNATSARALGVEDESSYRISSAIFGALSVPALFLLGEAMAGAAVGGVAAAALASSEWHVAFSRINRMYVPFLFFYIVAAFFGWRWLMEGRRRDGVLFLVVGGISLSLHQLGVSLILIPLIGLVLDDSRPAVVPSLLAVVALVLTSILYNEGFVGAPYDRWQWSGANGEGSDSLLPLLRLLERTALPPSWLAGSSVAGTLFGAWAARRLGPVRVPDCGSNAYLFRTANYGLLAIAGALAGAGQLYGFALFVAIYAVLLVGSPAEAWARVRIPFVTMTALAVSVAALPLLRSGFREAVRTSVTFPFPFPAFMVEQSVGFAVLLAGATIGVVFWRTMRSISGLRTSSAFVLLFIGGLGLVSAWGPTRYYFPLYPFWLIAGSALLVGLIAFAPRGLDLRPRTGVVTLFSVCLVLSGVTGGHGVVPTWNVVTLHHGEATNSHTHGVPFRPDHRTPGRALAGSLEPADVVVAEDPLQVAWYAGRADIWLRAYEDARSYLHRTADGELRDIYVASRLVTDVDELSRLQGADRGRVWLVTSGETATNREYYLDESQRRWLDSVESSRDPVVRGRDGATHLYCLDCGVDPVARQASGPLSREGTPGVPLDTERQPASRAAGRTDEPIVEGGR